MISSPLALATHERRFQAVVVGGLVTVFAIVALSPHTERALFEEGRIPAAFAAVVPAPIIPTLRRFGVMTPTSFARAFRSGRPTSPAGPARTVLSNLVPGTVPDSPVNDSFLTPATDGPPVLVSDASGLTPASSAGAPGPLLAALTPGFGLVGSGPGPTGTTPTPDPVATATPAPEPTAVPTATPTSTPTATPTSTPTATPTATPTDTPVIPPVTTPTPTPDPVSPVPEPASWMMLLTGMALVGVVTRRARRGKRQAAAV